ncbi:isoprenoid synthase domain-containing protein [Infundibulicybe gibba]|nr:isoprenoid synthase domain-containing protein [Infundibulicybe gibba]
MRGRYPVTVNTVSSFQCQHTFYLASFLRTSFRANWIGISPRIIEVSRTVKHSPSLGGRDIRADIQEVVRYFLSRCSIPLCVTAYDHAFENICYKEAHRRGYPVSETLESHSIHPFLPGGVVMATTAYRHLTDQSTRIFIALYTAFLIYLDDVFRHDVSAISQFNDRFINQQPQGDAVLDSFANLLLECPQHFGRFASNMIVTSTLNLVTAMLLEYETCGMTLSPHVQGFPTFSRNLSGASEAYALFIFPPEIPLQSYIQVRFRFDILSFYKEECAGEKTNRVSTLANSSRKSKLEVLEVLSRDSIQCKSQLEEAFRPTPAASRVVSDFFHGYVGFHASLKRYRLVELGDY